ncbi:hypothetical protein [Gimesia aquarii]|nr:hypothetical protein [Gimesia aquarii]
MLEQEETAAWDDYHNSTNGSINDYKNVTDNLQSTYDSAIASAESAYSTSIDSIATNLDGFIDTALQGAISDLEDASNTLDAALDQIAIDHPTIAAEKNIGSGSTSSSGSTSGSSSGSGSGSSSTTTSGSASSSTSNSTSGSTSSSASSSGSSSSPTSGSTSSSGSTSGSSNGSASSSGASSGSSSTSYSGSGSGSSSGSNSGNNTNPLPPDYLSEAITVNQDGSYVLASTGDTYKDGAAAAWIDYINGNHPALSNQASTIDSINSDYENESSNNNDSYVNSILNANTTYSDAVNSANASYSQGIISVFGTYFSDLGTAVNNYNSASSQAHDTWVTTTIAAAKAYISTVGSAWGTYQTTVVQAAIDAKSQMEQAIFAYQDWYQNEPYPHGYSGTDADGDGIYEIPGGPDLVPGKQHDLAVTIATIDLDLQTKYANASYTYAIAKWDAWLTYLTDTTHANKEYNIGITNAEKDYKLAADRAATDFKKSLVTLEESRDKAITNANTAYIIDLATATKNLLAAQSLTNGTRSIDTNNAASARLQAEISLRQSFLNAESSAWYQSQLNNSSLSTADASDREAWENEITNATLGMSSSVLGISTSVNNSMISAVTNAASSVAGIILTYTQSTTNADRNLENGTTTAAASLINGLLGADNSYASKVISASAAWANTLEGLKANFIIGQANIVTINEKQKEALARDEKIKTAQEYLDQVTNETSSPDYYLDGNNYQDAFNFVPEAYYYDAGLYLDFGAPLGSRVEDAQTLISQLEGGASGSGSTSSSGSTPGSSSSSGSGSASGEGSTSSSGSSSTSSSSPEEGDSTNYTPDEQQLLDTEGLSDRQREGIRRLIDVIRSTASQQTPDDPEWVGYEVNPGNGEHESISGTCGRFKTLFDQEIEKYKLSEKERLEGLEQSLKQKEQEILRERRRGNTSNDLQGVRDELARVQTSLNLVNGRPFHYYSIALLEIDWSVPKNAPVDATGHVAIVIRTAALGIIGYVDGGAEIGSRQGNIGGEGNIFFPEDIDPNVLLPLGDEKALYDANKFWQDKFKEERQKRMQDALDAGWQPAGPGAMPPGVEPFTDLWDWIFGY